MIICDLLPHHKSPMSEPARVPKGDWTEAVAKSEEHLVAADALASAGNHAMAFSHIVLGLEEWMKKNILHAVELGMTKFGTPDKVDPLRVRKQALTNHETKQMTGLASILLMLPFIERMKFIAQAQSEGRTPTREELEAKFRVDCQRASKLAPYIPRLEDLKQAGLYSGKKTSRGRAAVSATQEEFEQFRAILAGWLEFGRWVAAHPPSKAEIEEQKGKMADLRTKLRPLAAKAVETSAASERR